MDMLREPAGDVHIVRLVGQVALDVVHHALVRRNPWPAAAWARNVHGHPLQGPHLVEGFDVAGGDVNFPMLLQGFKPVSYTHLTLPTN